MSRRSVAPAVPGPCGSCGRSVRTHVCPSYGLALDRDENAALTMLRAGQARQAVTWPGGASVV
jgi:transposase